MQRIASITTIGWMALGATAKKRTTTRAKFGRERRSSSMQMAQPEETRSTQACGPLWARINAEMTFPPSIATCIVYAGGDAPQDHYQCNTRHFITTSLVPLRASGWWACVGSRGGSGAACCLGVYCGWWPLPLSVCVSSRGASAVRPPRNRPGGQWATPRLTLPRPDHRRHPLLPPYQLANLLLFDSLTHLKQWSLKVLRHEHHRA